MMLKASVTLSENSEKQIGEKHRNEVITSCKYDFIILPDCCMVLFIFIYLFIYFLSFCYFFRPLLQHMEVPRLGVELEL